LKNKGGLNVDFPCSFCLNFGKGVSKVTTYKTVLAPNAPWPSYEKKVAPKPEPKVRSKPSETDAKFEQWLKGLKK